MAPPNETTPVANRVFRRCEYTALPIQVNSMHLDFILDECTVVHAKIEIALAPNHGVDSIRRDGLYLNGRKDITLVSLRVNGTELRADTDYTLSENGIQLHGETLASAFGACEGKGVVTIESTVHIRPRDNTLLEGLYLSSGNFCTQCEAEGFRGITYFFDRPDVLTKYTTRLEADCAAFPVLLSNGNPIAEGTVEGNPSRHYAVWYDPFPKPSYLFALVAGQLLFQEDSFTTQSGKAVCLRIYTQPKNINRVDHAMASLKKAMRWDEEAFGREYDLERFNIVAVDDFNMGAMENKSLNIFNSRAVLATGNTATDAEFQRIEGIVAHEYFHNWTGNRVTCRDWFQLTLKEGLTVYRDQEFSSDMNSRDVYRLGVVSTVRSLQFPQDQGPLAHPIRPDTYEKIDNFYTITVYRKGAEIIRIYETVLGKAGFRKGMDLYFERHDGQAVTCEEFRAAMEDANGVDLSVLARWYAQPGTPTVHITCEQQIEEGVVTLRIRQETPTIAGYPEPQPVLIPVRVALLRASDGAQVALQPSMVQSANGRCSQGRDAYELVLHLEQAEQCFVLSAIPKETCVLSAMRGFSAPVVYNVNGESPKTWGFLLENDTDGFVRYESAQRLVGHCIQGLYRALAKESHASPSSLALEAVAPAELKPIVDQLVVAYRSLLKDSKTDTHLKSYLLSFPSNAEQILQIPECQPPLLYAAKQILRRHIAQQLSTDLWPMLSQLTSGADAAPYAFNSKDVARRAIVNTLYSLLAALPADCKTPHDVDVLLCERQRTATNMTDEVACLYALNARVESASAGARAQSLQMFHEKWKDDDLVLIHWFAANAVSEAAGNVATLRAIMALPEFSIKNPNKCYALLSAFEGSMINFHNIDGSGYVFMADAVLAVDAVNHQVAAKIALSFNIYKQLDATRREHILQQLRRIAECPTLSPNVREVISKNLNAQ